MLNLFELSLILFINGWNNQIFIWLPFKFYLNAYNILNFEKGAIFDIFLVCFYFYQYL